MRKLLLFAIVVCGFSVLRAQEAPVAVAIPDIAGTYAGKAPCADCEFIETELELAYGTDTSGEFSLRDKYVGKQGGIMSRVKGEWARVVDAKAGVLVVLNNDLPEKAMYYRLTKDGNLLPLDQELNKVESPIDCTLRRKLQ